MLPVRLYLLNYSSVYLTGVSRQTPQCIPQYRSTTRFMVGRNPGTLRGIPWPATCYLRYFISYVWVTSCKTSHLPPVIPFYTLSFYSFVIFFILYKLRFYRRTKHPLAWILSMVLKLLYVKLVTSKFFVNWWCLMNCYWYHSAVFWELDLELVNVADIEGIII